MYVGLANYSLLNKIKSIHDGPGLTLPTTKTGTTVATRVTNRDISAVTRHLQHVVKHAGNVEGKPFVSGLQDEATLTRLNDKHECGV